MTTLQDFGLGANLTRGYIPAGTTKVQDLRAQIAKLEVELSRQHASTAMRVKELSEIHAEARELRKQLRLGGRMVRITMRAHGDALQLINLYRNGMPTTRENARKMLLMTKRRWNWAKSLSKSARIHGDWEFYESMPADINQTIRDLREKADYIIRHQRWDMLHEYQPNN